MTKNFISVVIVGGAFAMLILLSRVGMTGESTDTRKEPPPLGKRVDIGGWPLHIYCTGKGRPTVVLVNGAGGFSFDWALVQPEVAQFTRVCSYDPSGMAWSGRPPRPEDIDYEGELHTLLQKARVQGPYVLVGHSLGGLQIRKYARRYPKEGVGMVFVDSTHENSLAFINGKLTRISDVPPPPPPPEGKRPEPSPDELAERAKIRPPYDKLPPALQALRAWFRSHPKPLYDRPLILRAFEKHKERAQAESRLLKTEGDYPFGDMPIIVLAAGRLDGRPRPPGVSVKDWEPIQEQIKKDRPERQKDLARLSRNSQLIIAKQSGHEIHLDEPELVVEAIRQVIMAARRHTQLTPVEAK